MEQSNIITQEFETVEKTNIFNKESVIIEHRKTTTKLSRSNKPTKNCYSTTKKSLYRIKNR